MIPESNSQSYATSSHIVSGINMLKNGQMPPSIINHQRGFSTVVNNKLGKLPATNIQLGNQHK
jgi:hypothetical protein